jgi:endoglucanase
MKLKAVITLFILIICLVVSAQPVKVHGQLKVVGTKILDVQDQAVVLRGMSLGWHNLWPRFYNEGVVKTLYQDWNCSVIRAAMGVELNDFGFLKSPESSASKVKAIVDAAIKQGIYVIIDWHSHNIKEPEAKRFFTEMATKYGKYPNVIYEIFNEPDYETWEEVKKYSIEIISTIRTIDADNIILVGSPRWDQDILLPANDPIKGFQNLMYSVHFYAGTHKQWLRDNTDIAIGIGLPIFISECAGMEATGDGPINYEEWKKWIDWMDLKGLSWITWSVSDKNETCSVLYPTAASNGKWKDADLKESGLNARAYLRNYPSVSKINKP